MLAALTNFIPKLSTLTHPLYELIGTITRNWSPNSEKAFCAVKCALASATMLAHYDHKLLVELSVDASLYGLGAVIMHVIPMETVARLPKRHELRKNTKNATGR